MERIKATLILAVVALAAVQANMTARINGGLPVDTIRRFPYHVTIHTTTSNGRIRYCSGSIIADQWILTSIGCLYQGEEYRLDFDRLYLNRTQGSFSVVVDKSYTYEYPTGYDDVALVKIPLTLQFSSTIRPISVADEGTPLGNMFAVMAGFNSYDDKLTYGMFKVIPNASCEKSYGPIFDAYLQMCTRGWTNNRQTPCEGNQGGGLAINWPNDPKLIGVFSTPLNCDNNNPAIHMRVSRYRLWIESITGKLSVEGTTHQPPFIPTTGIPN